MPEHQDPFSFQQLPSAADHVNEAFAKLNLRETEAPTFHAFLVAALTPYEKITRRNSESFNNETNNRLTEIINTIAFVRSKCQPYYQFSQDLPETLLIVASMPSLPNNGYSHMSDMLRNPFHVQTIAEAHRSFLALRNVTNQLTKSGLERKFVAPDVFSSLSRSEKLLFELRAAQTGRDAVRAIDRGANEEALSHAFGLVAGYRPLLAQADSQMAKYFHSVDEALGTYLATKGAPAPKTTARLGDKLRMHTAADNQSKTADTANKNTPQEGSEPPTNVVVVAFGRTGPKVL